MALISRERPNIAIAAVAGVGTLVALAFLSKCITIIPAGQVGVVDFFGNVSQKTLKPGVNLTNPLSKVIKFSTQTQEIKETVETPSKEGLTIALEASLLYRLDPEQAAQVYQTIGRDYVNVILVPQFRSVIRGTTSGYNAQALYTSQREELSIQIQQDLANVVSSRGIIVEDTPLRKIGLPPTLQQAIEAKLKAEQESQQMQFTLEKERQEAERKRIEAQGIADYQRIVSQGLSEQVLQLKGIEATEKLAQSPNAKVVVIGAGKGGLPLILQSEQNTTP
ncbi:prohibitin family protein [Desertifilum sp. FACHB-1129]|uniref:Membrane protease subunit, stomatin/prohibitin n=1 Tax=Desertifilum tharense IPPAS B-1220 TaxID=1781255 RepID=A0A1E5QKB1_9CYAN|nr:MULTISPECIES: prohibitin family protein [Desertifilum]MCD8488784.1 prohibitin family protein [Desertifilum sp.]MDA0211825.1 prohibitin family protein [Cyanobacteria bacterium FC1]MBD2312054.1 prohibitin family protein [Desertifilum sp. FACHB-1129]MBD2322507.1 prohibitin family protein [Desertifilum sp. FACHB-866]MBD2332670.1 prohibitin family protein [Desertifilum sp. FACHB-868]